METSPTLYVNVLGRVKFLVFTAFFARNLWLIGRIDTFLEVEFLSVIGSILTLFRNVFFFDVLYPKTSVEICVKSCPDKALMTPEEVLDFYKRTRSKLCRYDIKPKDYLNEALYAEDGSGPCPKLPVFAE